MIIPVSHTDLRWGYLAQLLNIGSGLILLPFVMLYLSIEQVGLWFVFITLGAFAYLLEFGFQPTVSRNTTYVFAGALNLPKAGLPYGFKHGGPPNVRLLAELIAGSRFIYRVVAALAVLVLICGGTFYICTLLEDKNYRDGALIGWWLYAIGLIINFYFGYVNALIQGRGDVTLVNKALITSRCFFITVGLVGLYLGLGLVGLGAAMLISSVVGRWLTWRYLRANVFMAEAMTLHEVSGPAVAKIMWHNASRLGIVQVNTFLIQRANILVAASFLGLAPAASYGLTVTLLITLSAVSMAVLPIRLPALTHARVVNDREGAKALFGEVLLLSWLLYIVGFALLFFAGNQLLYLFKEEAMLLPALSLFILGLIFALEMNHSIAATFLTTRNAVPFLWASIMSGIFIFCLSLWLVYEWQVWGLIASQGIVQLAYNNWRWPMMARQELKYSWKSILYSGVKRLQSSFVSRSS